jgi:hypothetical protein
MFTKTLNFLKENPLIVYLAVAALAAMSLLIGATYVTLFK